MMTPVERFGGPEGKEDLKGFIRFCRAGDFLIA